uniref:Uncharacterized protein n=1 Tax=Peronospora matthiolae TaxID=2874970 RepID=A0AAV1VDJ5_9STRA
MGGKLRWWLRSSVVMAVAAVVISDRTTTDLHRCGSVLGISLLAMVPTDKDISLCA